MGLLEKQVASELAQWGGFKAAGLDEKKIEQGLTRPPKPDMGDLAFATFRFAKDAGKSPVLFAQELLQEAGGGKQEAGKAPSGSLIASASAAGPYVNLRLNRAAACQAALHAIESTSPGNDPSNWCFGNNDAHKGKTLVLDLSSPNIAKPLAVHHLRSTMIGNSVKKLRESQGWRVVGVNHLGDWGTGFGKLIAGVRKYFPNALEAVKVQTPMPLGDMSVSELNAAYQRFNSEDADDALGAREFAELERENRKELERRKAGSAEFNSLAKFAAEKLRGAQVIVLEGEMEEGFFNWVLWLDARSLSLEAFNRVYARLGLKFFNPPVNWPASLWREYHPDPVKYQEMLARVRADVSGKCIFVGESAFALGSPYPTAVIESARKTGAATESNGALVIFIDGQDKPPVFLVKSDGATSYHVRDMAAALFRHDVLGADELAYVVGAEQRLHFNQLFKALKLIGHEWAERCSHVDFGLMLFKNDKGGWEKTSTRRGTAIMLEDLLDEAVTAVREIIVEKNPELAADSAYAEQVAQAVGTGAVVFNDLKNGRRNNIKFDWDAVLDFQGESGPYMQMQYVRMCSVLDKFVAESEQRYGRAHTTEDLSAADVALLTHEEEWKIVLQLAAFPDAIAKASEEFEPSVVSRYLIELASLTSTWWTVTKDTRIVGDDAQLSLARVRLVNAIRKVLGRGLTLLGMTLVERM